MACHKMIYFKVMTCYLVMPLDFVAATVNWSNFVLQTRMVVYVGAATC